MRENMKARESILNFKNIYMKRKVTQFKKNRSKTTSNYTCMWSLAMTRKSLPSNENLTNIPNSFYNLLDEHYSMHKRFIKYLKKLEEQCCRSGGGGAWGRSPPYLSSWRLSSPYI